MAKFEFQFAATIFTDNAATDPQLYIIPLGAAVKLQIYWIRYYELKKILKVSFM